MKKNKNCYTLEIEAPLKDFGSFKFCSAFFAFCKLVCLDKILTGLKLLSCAIIIYFICVINVINGFTNIYSLLLKQENGGN